MSISKRGYGLASLVAVLLIHNLAPDPPDTWLWTGVRNALHVPMFMLVTYILWSLLPLPKLLDRCAAVLAASLLFAFISEWVQGLASTGIAALSDVLNDMIASILTLGILVLLQHRRADRRWLHLNAVAACSAGLLLAAAVPVARVATVQMHRNDIFPTLVDYRANGHLIFHSCRADCRVTNGGQLRVHFNHGDWPGVSIAELPFPNVEFAQLRIEFALDTAEPFNLLVNMRDESNLDNKRTVSHPIAAGQRVLNIPLAELRPTPPHSAQVRIGLFTKPQHAGRNLWLHSMRYEPAQTLSRLVNHCTTAPCPSKTPQ